KSTHIADFVTHEMRQDWLVNRDRLLAFWKSGEPISKFFPDSKPWLLGSRRSRLGAVGGASVWRRPSSGFGLSGCFSIRRRGGGLYYGFDCGSRRSIQMRKIHDLTLHPLAFRLQKFLEVLQCGRQLRGKLADFVYRV